MGSAPQGLVDDFFEANRPNGSASGTFPMLPISARHTSVLESVQYRTLYQYIVRTYGNSDLSKNDQPYV